LESFDVDDVDDVVDTMLGVAAGSISGDEFAGWVSERRDAP